MQYRTLGKTRLSVSALSLGGAGLGGEYGPVGVSDAIRTVHEALDLGINFIDTSPYYGRTRAESVLGQALQGIERSRYILATKVGRYDKEHFDFSAARVTASVEESLVRLGVDYVDIIQCHDIEFGSLDQVIHETLPALRKVQEQGKARFVGITGLPLKIFDVVMARADVDTILSYCHYSLNDTSLVSLLPMLETKATGIISAAPLSMGLLSGKALPGWHPAPPDIREACGRAAQFCRENGQSLPKVALQFALANNSIHTILAGTAIPEEVRRNVLWAEESFDAEFAAQVRRVLGSALNRTWPVGRAENN